MADELIDIYDEHNEPTGVQEMKSIAHRDGLWHRTVHVWLYNEKDEILLQLRAKDKELYPGKWDISVAGHIGAGEDVVTSAIREAKEELGIDILNKELISLGTTQTCMTWKGNIDNQFHYVYLLKTDKRVEDFIFHDKEVEKVVFKHIDELEDDIHNRIEDYVPRKESWLDIIQEIRKRIS